jgi:CRISPR-associated protein Cas1
MPIKPSHLVAPIVHLVGPGKIKIINRQFAFSTGEGTPQRLDVNALRAIVCHGPVGVTDDAMLLLFQRGIEVSWVSRRNGRCRGRIVPAHTSQTNLRSLQHRAFVMPEFRLALARDCVTRKIQSQFEAARYYQQQRLPGIGPIISSLRQLTDRAAAAPDLPALRGVEGTASARWFEVLRQVVLPPFKFPGRVKRPPTDPVNALLSLGYTWLCNRVCGQIEATGLELNLGALHDDRPGRPSLACDLMEPFRVPAVDRWVLRQLNRSELTPDHFIQSNDNQAIAASEARPPAAVRLTREAFTKVLQSWEHHWLESKLSSSLELAIENLLGRIRSVDRVVHDISGEGGVSAESEPPY